MGRKRHVVSFTCRHREEPLLKRLAVRINACGRQNLLQGALVLAQVGKGQTTEVVSQPRKLGDARCPGGLEHQPFDVVQGGVEAGAGGVELASSVPGGGERPNVVPVRLILRDEGVGVDGLGERHVAGAGTLGSQHAEEAVGLAGREKDPQDQGVHGRAGCDTLGHVHQVDFGGEVDAVHGMLGGPVDVHLPQIPGLPVHRDREGLGALDEGDLVGAIPGIDEAGALARGKFDAAFGIVQEFVRVLERVQIDGRLLAAGRGQARLEAAIVGIGPVLRAAGRLRRGSAALTACGRIALKRVGVVAPRAHGGKGWDVVGGVHPVTVVLVGGACHDQKGHKGEKGAHALILCWWWWLMRELCGLVVEVG